LLSGVGTMVGHRFDQLAIIVHRERLGAMHLSRALRDR
jgi:hypothetical protein